MPSKLRAGSNGPLFSIHCGDQELDRLGGGYTVNIYILSMTDILADMNFHEYRNDAFAIGSSVAKQQHGVAIGGLCSAQAAHLLCMVCEWSSNTSSSSLARKMSRRLPKHILSIPPYKDIDNVVGAMYGSIGLRSKKKSLPCLSWRA